MHTQFLKRLLGVNRSTTNVLVRGELEEKQQEKIPTRNINYMKYLENKDIHILVKKAKTYEPTICRKNRFSV